MKEIIVISADAVGGEIASFMAMKASNRIL